MDTPEFLRDGGSPEEYRKTLALMVEGLVRAAPILAKAGLKDDEAWGAYSAVFTALHRLGLTKIGSHPTEERTRE